MVNTPFGDAAKGATAVDPSQPGLVESVLLRFPAEEVALAAVTPHHPHDRTHPEGQVAPLRAPRRAPVGNPPEVDRARHRR